MKTSKYKGREAITLTGADTTLRIVPSLGGRILQISMGGYDYLFENRALEGVPNTQGTASWDRVWQNFGGEKVWPAPQGWDNCDQWPGPPDPVLDGGSYTVQSLGRSVVLTSPDDPAHTGLRASRTITLDPTTNTIRIEARFANIDTRPRRWSLWPVIQLATPNPADAYLVTIPLAGPSAFPGGFGILHGVVNNPQFSREGSDAVVDYRYMLGKMGTDSQAGIAAYYHPASGKTMVVRFNPVAGAEYPDGTCLQVWTQGHGAIFSRGTLRTTPDNRSTNPAYLEIELLSPLTEIRPGESASFDYRMQLCTLPCGKRVREVGDTWVCSEPLEAHIADGRIHIRGSYGFFGPGELILGVQSSNTRTERRIAVCATQGTQIDLSEACPSGEAHITLQLKQNNLLSKINEIELCNH